MQINSRYRNVIGAVLLLIVVLIMGAWIKFLFTPVVTDENGLKYTVRTGASMHSVITDWTALNIIRHPTFFRILVDMKGGRHQLKAGEYLFRKGATPSVMLHQITTGTGIIYHSFMIVPGWNFKDLKNAMVNNLELHHTIQNLSDTEIMKRLGHPELKPEGEFYPDTYFFVEGSDDLTILKRAFKVMEKKLNLAWNSRDPGLPFKTSYEALIAASIIEKEYYFQDELPKIAGVLVNRLRKDMLLQFDPTVIYGVGSNYNGTIRRTDLLADNPYNTYLHKGLPPTPISMPSFGAIQAVMHPMKHNYYYFVAQGIGAHQFSTHLNEHYKAVEEARKTKWFFNYALARYYLIKLFNNAALSFRY